MNALNIVDPVFNGMGRSEMYRALVVPELFPHENPDWPIGNWSPEERWAYCGVL